MWPASPKPKPASHAGHPAHQWQPAVQPARARDSSTSQSRARPRRPVRHPRATAFAARLLDVNGPHRPKHFQAICGTASQPASQLASQPARSKRKIMCILNSGVDPLRQGLSVRFVKIIGQTWPSFSAPARWIAPRPPEWDPKIHSWAH
jgi:hypothetical protein